jgi:hypothetical protein
MNKVAIGLAVGFLLMVMPSIPAVNHSTVKQSFTEKIKTNLEKSFLQVKSFVRLFRLLNFFINIGIIVSVFAEIWMTWGLKICLMLMTLGFSAHFISEKSQAGAL